VSTFERHPRTTLAVIAAVALAACLIAAEFGFRALRDLLRGGTAAARLETVADDTLGWSLNPERRRTERLNACGERVVRDPPPGRYLARVPPKPPSPDAKQPFVRILFIGDSHTHAHEVSTGAAYYDHADRLLSHPHATWAAGAGGYGTVQEYQLLQRLFGEVKPDVVVWQTTGNDVGENVYTGTDTSTVQRPRPYLDPDSGAIVLRNPSLWLLEHSELAKFLYGEFAKVDRRLELGLLGAFNRLFRGDAPDNAQVERAGLRVMETLVARAVREHPSTRFIGFAADNLYERQYREAFTRAGAAWLDGVPALVAAGPGRTDCLPVDGHWNHNGNERAGAVLARVLDPLLVTPGATR
jgi:hypothetical protein